MKHVVDVNYNLDWIKSRNSTMFRKSKTTEGHEYSWSSINFKNKQCFGTKMHHRAKPQTTKKMWRQAMSSAAVRVKERSIKNLRRKHPCWSLKKLITAFVYFYAVIKSHTQWSPIGRMRESLGSPQINFNVICNFNSLTFQRTRKN